MPLTEWGASSRVSVRWSICRSDIAQPERLPRARREATRLSGPYEFWSTWGLADTQQLPHPAAWGSSSWQHPQPDHL